ncbi:hypothetical protein [Domibacillus indicus]|nr:hypothetical protein [Domibacillus indicus]
MDHPKEIDNKAKENMKEIRKQEEQKAADKNRIPDNQNRLKDTETRLP